MTGKAHFLSESVAPRIYSRLVMVSCKSTTVVHVKTNAQLDKTFVASSMELVHVQPMNMAIGLLVIKVDFLARELERMLHAIATT